MNFTSGTTGDPKGVVYSHRSMFLHAMGVSNAGVLPITDRDRVLVVVPMFHVNAWVCPMRRGWREPTSSCPPVFSRAVRWPR